MGYSGTLLPGRPWGHTPSDVYEVQKFLKNDLSRRLCLNASGYHFVKRNQFLAVYTNEEVDDFPFDRILCDVSVIQR